MATSIRRLAWLLAVSLVLATLIRIGDNLNIFATPPTVPDTDSLAQRLLAFLPYKQAIWPVFLAWNGLFGIAFLLLIPLASLLARGLGGATAAVRGGTTLLAAGGIIGAVGTAAVLGAVDLTVSVPYCDCTSKETEVIAASAAQSLIEGSGAWLGDVGLVLAAIGLLWLAQTFIARLGSSPFALLAWIAPAAVLVAVVFDRLIAIDTVSDLVPAVVFGIILPLWAVGIARGANAFEGASAT